MTTRPSFAARSFSIALSCMSNSWRKRRSTSGSRMERLFPDHYCMRPPTIAIAALLASLIACNRTPPTRANIDLHGGALAGSNVLLITIDTLRADRVGSRLTPALDRIASGGIRFTQAHAHAPLTLPAHTSILTGLVPPTHGVHNNGFTALAPST